MNNHRGVSPQRPPRKRSGGKHEYASAGLLVSVVRTLTTSTSEANREFEKERLQKGYRETEQAVDGLITVHKDDLTKSLSTFRKLSSDLTDARERVNNVKNNLHLCKTLLQCRRDELRRLWMESAEQRFILEYLQKIEDITCVSREVDEAVKEKHFLLATQRLKYGLDCLEKELTTVDGLRELHAELQQKKVEVYKEILDELAKQLYLKPSEELFRQLNALRGTSGRPASASAIAADESGMASLLDLDDEGSLKVSLQDSAILQDNGQAYEDLADSKPDSQPVQYIAILADALGLLGQIPIALEDTKMGLTKGLLKVVHHTTSFVLDYVSQEPSTSGMGDARHLADLLTLLFRQFRLIAALHGVFLEQVSRVLPASSRYSIQDVWRSIQSTLQMTLNDYLDAKASSTVPTSVDPLGTQALSSYFSRKRAAPPRSRQLFSFDSTSYAINVAEYARDRQLAAPPTLSTPRGETAETLYVCARKPDNVIVAFKPLMKLIKEIESQGSPAPAGAGQHCQLRQSLDVYMKETYLPKVRADTEVTLVSMSGAAAWSNLTTNEEARALDSPVPLLVSSVKLIEVCRHLAHLMSAMPTYAEQLAVIWLELLAGYHRGAREKYETITSPLITVEGTGEVGRRKISAQWVVDPDISRLLKSLPNWISLQEATRSTPSTPFSPASAPLTRGLSHQESTAEIRSRNARESEILIGNFSMAKEIEEREIISNVDQLKYAANMHESIGYFATTVRRLLAELPAFLQNRMRKTRSPACDKDSAQFTSLADEFEAHLLALDDMSATCLLLLHLEVRVHCFFYLLPIARKQTSKVHGYQSQDVDPLVTALNRKLVQLDEMLRSNLTAAKVRYVFEGLGHLVSAIFITSSQHINKMNDNDKKRMGRNILAIQSTLSTVTSTRESDLDHARKFFELLFTTPDQILEGIVEQQGEFTELEYTYLLGLAIRSHPAYNTEPGALERRLTRLREIMGRSL